MNPFTLIFGLACVICGAATLGYSLVSSPPVWAAFATGFSAGIVIAHGWRVIVRGHPV